MTAAHASALARTADRLAAAYAAHVGFLRTSRTPNPSLTEWVEGERAARIELRDAFTEYEQVRA